MVVTIRGFIDSICYCFEFKMNEITLLHFKGDGECVVCVGYFYWWLGVVLEECRE